MPSSKHSSSRPESVKVDGSTGSSSSSESSDSDRKSRSKAWSQPSSGESKTSECYGHLDSDAFNRHTSSSSSSLQIKIDFDEFDIRDQVEIVISQINVHISDFGVHLNSLTTDFQDGVILSILVNCHIPMFFDAVSHLPPEAKLSACLIASERYLSISTLGLTSKSFYSDPDMNVLIPFLVQFIDDSMKEYVIDVPLDDLERLFSNANNPDSQKDSPLPNQTSSFTDHDNVSYPVISEIKGERSDSRDEKFWRPLLIEEDIPPELENIECILMETQDTRPRISDIFPTSEMIDVPFITKEDIAETEQFIVRDAVEASLHVEENSGVIAKEETEMWLVFIFVAFKAKPYTIEMLTCLEIILCWQLLGLLFCVFQSADSNKFLSFRIINRKALSKTLFIGCVPSLSSTNSCVSMTHPTKNHFHILYNMRCVESSNFFERKIIDFME
jgi:hypothetical protein